MTRLPIVTGPQVVRALERGGFVIRIKGSHHFLRHSDDPTTKPWFPSMAAKILDGQSCARFSTTLG